MSNARSTKSSRVLVAGMGNVLRQDDGFGVEVAKRLAAYKGLPEQVRVVEVGIGGIHLVHELMDGYDALVVVDALERGSQPGSVHLLRAEVPNLDTWPEEARADFLADIHYTTPSKALILAKALGVLPSTVYIFGCQPTAYDDLSIGLSAPVEQVIEGSVERLVEEIRRMILTGV